MMECYQQFLEEYYTILGVDFKYQHDWTLQCQSDTTLVFSDEITFLLLDLTEQIALNNVCVP